MTNVIDNIVRSDSFRKFDHFLTPVNWESTFLRRLWTILIPITGPIWLVMLTITVSTLIMLLFMSFPFKIARSLFDLVRTSLWEQR